MCLARGVELRITTASVALRRILTAVDAAPLPGAGVEEEEMMSPIPVLPLRVSLYFLLFNLFPGYMGLIYTLMKTIVFDENNKKKHIVIFIFAGCSYK